MILLELSCEIHGYNKNTLRKTYKKVSIMEGKHYEKIFKRYNDLKLVELKPEYFSNSQWKDYKMFKEKETVFSKSRAHYEFERGGME